MKLNIGEMTDSMKKKVYNVLWRDNYFLAEWIEKTPWKRGKEGGSLNSYSFRSEIDDKDDVLCSIFKIEDADSALFKKQFRMACSGNGQEMKRITVLHSSSLCALLFFYNVTKKNPLTMNLDGQDVEFTESVFEYKSRVFDNEHPSNMDVVLIGRYKNKDGRLGKNVVLFLESKFAEYYLYAGTRLEVSRKYEESVFYHRDFLGKGILGEFGFEFSDDEDSQDEEERTCVLKSKKKCYLGGFKQMISHYIGISNACAKKTYEGDDKKPDDYYIDQMVQMKDVDVFLGEIVFDHEIGKFKFRGEGGLTCLDSYEKIYAELAQKVNEVSQEKVELKGRFKMLSCLLCYSDFRTKTNSNPKACMILPEHKVEEKIRQFYFGEDAKSP